MLLADRSENVAEQRHAREILDRKKPGAQAIVDVVGIIGNVVGNSRELRLGAGKAPQLEVLRPVMQRDGMRQPALAINPAWAAVAQRERTIMLDQPLERFPGKIQSIEGGVAPLERSHHPQRLRVVIEAATRRETAIERALAGVTEGRMAEIVGERERLGQILIEPERSGKRARDLGNLERVRQPGAEVVALMKDEDLGLVREAPECGRMDDAVAVAAEGVARCAHRLRMKPAAAPAGSGRVGGARAGHFNRHAEPPN